MRAKIAIIGGTSLLTSSLFSNLEPTTIETPHGKAIIYTSSEEENDLIFLQRHHADGDAGMEVYKPPHLINHRANFHAISLFQPKAILAVCSVGSLNKDYPPGTLCLPDDYFSTFNPTFCVYDDNRAHIVPSINSEIRDILSSCLTHNNIKALNTDTGITYVQTTGPRFETKSESRYLSCMGDIVGMTGGNEATAAVELNLKYCILSMIDNYANGLSEIVLTNQQFKENVKKHQIIVEHAVKICIEKLLLL